MCRQRMYSIPSIIAEVIGSLWIFNLFPEQKEKVEQEIEHAWVSVLLWPAL